MTRARRTWTPGSTLAAVPAVRTHRVIALAGGDLITAGPRVAAGTDTHRARTSPRRILSNALEMSYPARIVCLTEETTETLYLLGEGDRVVGVSGYTVRPPEAGRKPRISSFLSARFDAIEALEPDLILAFSDLQADLTRELVRRGHAVFTFNQRSVAEILQMILIVGGLVGRAIVPWRWCDRSSAAWQTSVARAMRCHGGRAPTSKSGQTR